MLRWKDSFHPYAAITIVFWALAMVLTRLTLRYFSAFSLGFLRYLAASFALVLVALVTRMKPPKLADAKWFIASGGVGFFLYMIVFNKASQTVTAATGSVLLATAPVLTAAFAALFYKEKLCILQWVAIGVEFAGVVLITLINGAFSLNYGLAWYFLAILFLSAYNLLQRKLTKTYSGLQACTYSIFAGTLMLAIFSPQAVREAQGAPPIQLLYVAILGVFCSALAYVTWSQAFQKAELASSVSNYMFFSPLLTSLLGFVMADEMPDMPTIIGGAVILSGMLLFNFHKKVSGLLQRAKEPRKTPAP